jgi:hypothetical protein
LTTCSGDRAALPISFRPALLAGLSRAIADPAVLGAIQDETIFKGTKGFERRAIGCLAGGAVGNRVEIVIEREWNGVGGGFAICYSKRLETWGAS